MTTTIHRSAYGFTTAGREDPWERRAACAQDPELWHTGLKSIDWDRVGEARHICLRHCPVLAACLRDVASMPSAVVGGVFYNNHGTQSAWQPMADRCRMCSAAAR